MLIDKNPASLRMALAIAESTAISASVTAPPAAHNAACNGEPLALGRMREILCNELNEALVTVYGNRAHWGPHDEVRRRASLADTVSFFLTCDCPRYTETIASTARAAICLPFALKHGKRSIKRRTTRLSDESVLRPESR